MDCLERRIPRLACLATALVAGGVAFCHAGAAGDQAPDPLEAGGLPALARVDGETMRLGEITFRPAAREIRVPTRINMTEGLLEFALVHANGKVHESLLVTEASGLHLNVVLKLLRFQASEELFKEFDEDGSLSDRFVEVPAAVRKAARLAVAVEWNAGQTVKSVPLSEWISHAVTARPMPALPWIYGGSYVFDGRFAAESTGDLIATFVTRNALLNYAGEDNDNDEVWIPAPGRVPPEGTRVTVVMTPAPTSNDPKLSNPSKP